MIKPGYDNSDTLVVNQARLRAPSHLQARCQQQLMSLDSIPQDTGEYLFLRKVSIKSSPIQLENQIKTNLVEQSAQAIEGDSPLAESANAVRFSSLGHLLAQLTLDLQASRKAIWFWQNWQQLFELPVGEALASLWSEYASDLTDMVQVLAERNKLTAVWSAISQQQGEVIYTAVSRSLGIKPMAALHIVDSHSHSPTVLPSLAGIIHRQWRDVIQTHTPNDSSVRLAAMIGLLRWRPDLLLKTDAEQSIAIVAQSIVLREPRKQLLRDQTGDKIKNQRKEMPPAQLSSIEPTQDSSMDQGSTVIDKTLHESAVTDGLQEPHANAYARKSEKTFSELGSDTDLKHGRGDEHASEYDNREAIIAGQAVAGEGDSPNSAEQGINQKATPQKETVSRNSDSQQQAQPDQKLTPASQNKSPASRSDHPYKSVEQSEPSIKLPSQGTVYCQQGGIFYLLNFMARKNIQALLEQHQAYEKLNGPWGCLLRMADLLQRKPDPAFEQFVAFRMGLDDVCELNALPPLPNAELYQAQAEKLFGPHVWQPALLNIHGLIEYTQSHLDIHYPIDKVDVEVRRVGLDLNPGWLPWFGQVVTFHYQSELIPDGDSH